MTRLARQEHIDLLTQEQLTLEEKWSTPLVDIQKISDAPTQEVAQAVLQNPEFGKQVLKALLLLENYQYRGGKFPAIMSKAKGVYIIDTAFATDEHGNKIRTKEKADVLERIVKFSEIYELFIEIDKWFSDKEKLIKEYLFLVDVTEKFAYLVSRYAFESQDKKEEFENTVIQLNKYTQERKNLEYKLITEIVDLHYNLVHLMFLDKKRSPIYEYWLNTINQCLGWNLEESLALTITKYHVRVFQSDGVNNPNEYEQTALLVNDAFNLDPNKIRFPENHQLKKLVQVLNRMRRENRNPDIPEEISLPRCMDYFDYERKVSELITANNPKQVDTD